MPKVTEAHAAARKEQIVLAAMSCFANKGFHKTTMQDICKKADLSPGAVYSYFKSKDDIFEALAKVGQEMNENLFDMAGMQMNGDPKVGFTSCLSIFISQYKHPMFVTGARMDAMFLCEALTNHRLAAIITESYDLIMQRIIKLVTASQEAGHLRQDLDSEAVSQVLFSMVQGLGNQLLMSGKEKMDVDAYLKATVAIVAGELFTA